MPKSDIPTDTNHNWLCLLVTCILAVAGTPSVGHAIPGLLDPSFACGGEPATVYLGGVHARGGAVAVQPDGKVLVAGSYDYAESPFVVVRLTADGRRDPNFGLDGIASKSVGGVQVHADAVALQSDGKILVAGSYDSAQSPFLVIRFNSDGQLDTTFGTQGVAARSVGGVRVSARALAVQSDGKILVAGSYEDAAAPLVVVRFTKDGQWDTSFGTDGVTSRTIPGQQGYAEALAIQPDGKIVVAGHGAGVGAPYVVVRFAENGEIDESFGSGGLASKAVGGVRVQTTGIALQSDGKIVVAGSYEAADLTPFLVLRWTTNGQLDDTFGTGGIATKHVGGVAVKTGGVAIQPNGKIVVAGTYEYASGAPFLAVRFLMNGDLDEAFGYSGVAETTIAGVQARPRGIAIEGNGRIVIAGYYEDPSSDKWPLVAIRLEGDSPSCGNGVVEIGEACDLGPSGDRECCSESCQTAPKCRRETSNVARFGFSARATVPIPEEVGYVDGSFCCGLEYNGTCIGDTLTWHVRVGPSADIDLKFGFDSDIIASVNRSTVRKDAFVPIDLSYGPKVSEGITLALRVPIEVASNGACFLSGDQSNETIELSSTTESRAPLVADDSITLPVASNVVSMIGANANLQLLGHLRFRFLDTLATPPSFPVSLSCLPGLGGAGALLSVEKGGAVSPLNPLFLFPTQWQYDAPDRQVRSVQIAQPTPGRAADPIELALGPLFHWVKLEEGELHVHNGFTGTAAIFMGAKDYPVADTDELVAYLSSAALPMLDSVEQKLQTIVSTVAPNLQPLLQDVVDQYMDNITARVEGGALPIPVFDPERPLLDGGAVPELGTLILSIDTDADRDGLLDGDEIRDGTDPDFSCGAPTVRKPVDDKVVRGKKAALKWNRVDCATNYNVVVRQGSKVGPVVDQRLTTKKQIRTKPLESGKVYAWKVSACKEGTCYSGAWHKFSAQ